MSASSRTLVSRVWRTNAIPMPTSRPANAPRRRLRCGLGEVGTVGMVAGVIVVDSMCVPESRSRVVNSSAAPASASPVLFAISAARCGVGVHRGHLQDRGLAGGAGTDVDRVLGRQVEAFAQRVHHLRRPQDGHIEVEVLRGDDVRHGLLAGESGSAER